MNGREVLRYGVKGGAFVALNIAVQMLLVETGTLRAELAAAVSTAAMPLLGYVAMNRFVFPDAAAPSGRGHFKRFAQYLTANLSGKAANYGLFLALLWVGVWYPLAYLLGAGVVFAATFGVNRWLWHGELTA